MNFHNLPPTWNQEPLTDTGRAADVVDLMVSLGERRRGTFAAVLCDRDDLYIATVAIDLQSEFRQREPTLQSADLCTTALSPIIPALRTTPGSALILALGRPGPAFWPDLDAEWAEAATHICAAADVRLLGFYVASADQVYQPAVSSAAAA